MPANAPILKKRKPRSPVTLSSSSPTSTLVYRSVERIDPLGDWIWGLSLIALTVGIYASGVVFMADDGVDAPDGIYVPR